MKRRLMLETLFALLLLLGAGSLVPYHTTSDDLTPYVEKYQLHYTQECLKRKWPNHLAIEMADTLQYPIIGQCEHYLFGKRIVFNRAFWETASYQERNTLIAHELGHCVLGLQHRVDPFNYMHDTLPEITSMDLNTQVSIDVQEQCGQ